MALFYASYSPKALEKQETKDWENITAENSKPRVMLNFQGAGVIDAQMSVEEIHHSIISRVAELPALSKVPKKEKKSSADKRASPKFKSCISFTEIRHTLCHPDRLSTLLAREAHLK